MDDDIHEALARTAQLLRMDVFDTPEDDDRHIVAGLRATTARLAADRKNLTSCAGQTALVTLYAQLAMMGLQIDLDIPDVELTCPQPPLNCGDLPTALVNYSDDLLPGGSSTPGTKADITFALGDTGTPNPDIRVSGTATHAFVGPPDGARHVAWSGDLPIGAIAAAAAAAAEGARAAIARIATVLDRPHPANQFWTRHPGRRVDLDLSRYTGADTADIGEIDVISAGAITNAAVYTLLRMPGVQAALRVIDIDRLVLGNLNRYALGRRSLLRELKTTVLAGYTTTRISIDGQPQFLDDHTAGSLRPFAPALLVGVDHIPSRWIANERPWTAGSASAPPHTTTCSPRPTPPGSPAPGALTPRTTRMTGLSRPSPSSPSGPASSKPSNSSPTLTARNPGTHVEPTSGLSAWTDHGASKPLPKPPRPCAHSAAPPQRKTPNTTSNRQLKWITPSRTLPPRDLSGAYSASGNISAC
jgi:hypothetical protein